ncbi:PREDICTED: uncharacterized protein LOC104799911 [Tarenaya hassleriana]|uniref:uncharacterized protein LOC104799911 n=1 Tax=Tarenaya hassleriana TaxID=28532 RepID=UPI00053C99FC|nr:PREDICTED: uncharacterized protein LOC104799911 [Tarenaya hassleriana]
MLSEMASIPQIIICNFSMFNGFCKEPSYKFHAKLDYFRPTLLHSKSRWGASLMERRRGLVGHGEIGFLVSERGGNFKKRIITARFNRGLGFNGGGGGGGGDNSGNARVLGNLALAVGLTYLTMSGQLGWVLDAIVSVWLIVVLVPIVGLGALLWWAGRDIVQSSCPNCGNEFQIFKSTLDDEVQLCPFCTQPFSVVGNKFVKEPVKFSNQTTRFGQDLNGFSSTSKKGKGYSTAVVDVEAEVKDAE